MWERKRVWPGGGTDLAAEAVRMRSNEKKRGFFISSAEHATGSGPALGIVIRGEHQKARNIRRSARSSFYPIRGNEKTKTGGGGELTSKLPHSKYTETPGPLKEHKVSWRLSRRTRKEDNSFGLFSQVGSVSASTRTRIC